MSIRTVPSLAFAACLCAAGAVAQQAPTFAAPVRLKAGDAFLGGDRLYPSPMAHDVDGDGKLDLVVGDLRGRITIARRTDGTAPSCYAAETPMLAADGSAIDFHNW